MKKKILVFALASSALLAACTPASSTSATDPATSGTNPIVYTSEKQESSFEYEIGTFFETNASGDVVQKEDTKETGMELSVAQADATSKPTLSSGVLTLPIGSTFTLNLTSGEILHNTPDKNTLKFSEAVAADSLEVTGTTSIGVTEDGLGAEMTFKEDLTTYTVTAKAELKLVSVIVTTLF